MQKILKALACMASTFKNVNAAQLSRAEVIDQLYKSATAYKLDRYSSEMICTES